MNRLKEFPAPAELAVCCVVLLLAVALSAPLWLGFFGTVEAGSNSSGPNYSAEKERKNAD